MMAQIKKDRPARHSHLFTVRLWAEDRGQGRLEWRGQVQHILSGETHYFRDWAVLVDLLLRMLPKFKDAEPPDEAI
jgi:hypothetical protein